MNEIRILSTFLHLCIILLTYIGWQGKPDHADLEEKSNSLGTSLANSLSLLFWAPFAVSLQPQSGKVREAWWYACTFWLAFLLKLLERVLPATEFGP